MDSGRKVNPVPKASLGQMLEAYERIRRLSPIFWKAWGGAKLTADERAQIKEALDRFNATGMDGRYADFAASGVPLAFREPNQSHSS